MFLVDENARLKLVSLASFFVTIAFVLGYICVRFGLHLCLNYGIEVS